MKKNKFIIIGLLLIIFPIFFNGQHAQAYTYKHGKNTTLDKIVAKNLQQVYSAMKTKIKLNDVAGYGKGNYFYSYVLDSSKLASCGTVAMPNNIIESGSLTCEEFLLGKGSEWTNLIPKTEGEISFATAVKYFSGIGYTRKTETTGNAATEGCINGKIERQPGEYHKIAYSICGPVQTNSPSAYTVEGNSSTEPEYWFDRKQDGNCFGIRYRGGAAMESLDYEACLANLTPPYYLADILNGIKSDFDKKTEYGTLILDISDKNSTLKSTDYMQKGSFSEVSNKILKEKTVQPLNEVEVYNLYHGYITNSDRVNLKCSSTYDFKKDNSNPWYQVTIKRDGKINKNCYIQAKRDTKYSLAKKSKKNQYYLTQKNKSIKDLANAINALDLKSILSKVKDITATTSNKSSKTTDNKKTCYDAGVESMSWIICPAIDNTSQAVDGIEKVLRDWLQIDTNKVFKSQTYTAWEVFRNIANVALIIIFLIVIFSQLTGVGIDNYGIKKLLPKLIIMSLLINLSYVICEIAVDLSNILGVGLDDMFKGIGTAIRAGAGTGKETVSGIVAGLFTALGAAGAVGGTVITAISIGTGGGGVMLVISLILVLLVALVAVLMFFVMLGARMIIVIIFTVIAPVAFALYILPNTQNLFKKWWKIFQTALVVFPICGALYGASFIIKAIIFGGGEINFIWGLIAVCAPFLPFLLLPTLLKGALAGLGALGGTLTMLGNGLKKGLSQGNETIKGTDRYKAAQERNQERRIQRRAGINRNGEEIKMGRVGRFMRGGERGIARARAQYLKNQDTKSREDRLSSAVGFEAAQTAQAKAIDADKIKDYTMLINDRTRNGEDEDKLFGMYDDYMAKGDKLGALAVARIAGRRKDTAARFMSQKITGSGLTSDQQAALINSNNAHGDIFSSVAKEISTGENSRNYLESAPLGFEFASQVNKGDADTAGGYSGWVGKASTGDNGTESYDNLHNAVNNYVTDSKQLVGMKSGSLRELYDLASSGKMNQDDVKRLSDLAKETIKNKGTTGVWDTTKATEIENLAKLTGGAPSSTLIIHHSSGGGPRPGSKSSPI